MAPRKNGNGTNGHGKQRFTVTEGSIQTDERGFLLIDDLVVASVLLMYFIQKLGKASLEQIGEKVENAQVAINEYLLRQGVEALQARGYVSYGKGRNEAGEVVSQWKPRKANFVGAPDVAQVTKAFLSNLVSTADADEIANALNAKEEEGDGQSKAKEKLKYADFYMAEVTFRTRTRDGGGTGTLIGGRPSSPAFDTLVEKGPKYPVECNLRFPRNSAGRPVIPISNIRGWFSSGLRFFNMSPAAMGYVGIDGGLIEENGGPPKIRQIAQQVVDLSGSGFGGGGRGISTYEAIDAGATFKFRFTIPKRGGPCFEQFVFMLINYAANSPRGLSNARSNENGFVEIIDVQDLGDFRDAHGSVRANMSGMSSEARDFAQRMLDKLKDRTFDVFKGTYGDPAAAA